MKERKTFKLHKIKNVDKFFEFSQNIYKSIKLKVTENQIDWVIEIDAVKKNFKEG